MPASAVAAGAAAQVVRGSEDEQPGHRIGIAVVAGARRRLMGRRDRRVLGHWRYASRSISMARNAEPLPPPASLYSTTAVPDFA